MAKLFDYIIDLTDHTGYGDTKTYFQYHEFDDTKRQIMNGVLQSKVTITKRREKIQNATVVFSETLTETVNKLGSLNGPAQTQEATLKRLKKQIAYAIQVVPTQSVEQKYGPITYKSGLKNDL